MRFFWIGILVLFSLVHSQGQSTFRPVSLDLAYYANMGIQPGVKLGSQWRIKDQSTSSKSVFWYVSPQLGYFTRPGNHQNYFGNLEFGYQRSKPERNWFSSFGLGIAYLVRSNQLSQSINLGSGEIQGRSRSNTSFLWPSLSYGFGSRLGAQMNWFGKISAGLLMDDQQSTQANGGLELGLRYQLN